MNNGWPWQTGWKLLGPTSGGQEKENNSEANQGGSS